LSADFGPDLDKRRRLIDTRLSGYLDAEAARTPAELLAAMRYSLLGGGKRLRPLLVLLAAEACGGRADAALPAACAVEMVHCYSLVHDDLPAMDDDDLRRGRPTCHKQFGEAVAILVGDGLLTLAFQVLAEEVRPASVAVQCCQTLARAAGVAGMVGGQADDLAWEQRGGTLEVLQAIHERKTGALFRAALRLGGLIGLHANPHAGEPEQLLAALDRCGECLGLAFQIADDLLDVEGTAEQAGKRVKKDAGRGKLTYPALLGVAESRRRVQALGRDAVAHLSPLGEAARPLAALVQLLVERKR
jgi:geranylgeranyl diphosphate synthase type II